jgi:pyruvate dehydrogenase (quinone)
MIRCSCRLSPASAPPTMPQSKKPLAVSGAMARFRAISLLDRDLPIKIVVYDNGKLGFVDIEQKAAGLVPVYTDLKNPDFGEVAKAMGLWGRSVAKAGELEESIQSWLAQPGPALLHVKVKPMQLVMPPSPFVSPEAVVGMGVYTARAMLQGKGHDVWEMMVENIP